MARRLFRKAVQQGRSERRGEAYSVPYVEPLSDARTPLAGFINSLLAKPASILTEMRLIYYCEARLGDRLAVGRQSLDLTT